MPRNDDASSSMWNRLALWQWGLLCIVVGPLASMTTAFIMNAPDVPITNEQRGAAFGRGLVAVLMVITGVVLIILHFARRKPTKRKRRR